MKQLPSSSLPLTNSPSELPGKHQKVPKEDQFYPDLFYSSLLGRVYCSFSVFFVPDESANFLLIIFLPLLGVLLPNFRSGCLVWNSREHGFPAEELADAMSRTLVLLAMMVYFIRTSSITLIQGTSKLASTKTPVACWADFLTFLKMMTSKRISDQEAVEQHFSAISNSMEGDLCCLITFRNRNMF